MGGHVCPWWFAYTFDNPLRILFHKPAQIFAPYVQAGMTVADIGCGFGYFAIGLAAMVEKEGTVIAVDIQSQMLEKAKKRAGRAGVADTIRFRQCRPDDITISETLDFAVAFWMLHETPDIGAFLDQVLAVLKPQGLLLVTEPRFHVSATEFAEELDIARQVGLAVMEEPGIAFSHAAVLAHGKRSVQ